MKQNAGKPPASHQLFFSLEPENPYSSDYFVSHSGVALALQLICAELKAALNNPSGFHFIYVYGPAGSGKSHLVSTALESTGYPSNSVLKMYLPENGTENDLDQTWIPHFITEYERAKSCGGVVILESDQAPDLVSNNPHLTSRLRMAVTVAVRYPHGEELRPLLLSLLERRNLRISEYSLNYLLSRLPVHPLSFDRIFAKLSALSLERGVPAKQPLIRESLSLSNSKINN